MDVAKGITNIVMDHSQNAGKTFEFTGLALNTSDLLYLISFNNASSPQRMTVVDMINYVQQVTFRPLYVIRIPQFAYR